ncbi:MAG TPA: hypothetical protein VMG58_16050 [Candidatus Sulfotelmatobacter sp.]|nr:hypothetical protein [Candidatus Sulfotelmatobacter sp.]
MPGARWWWLGSQGPSEAEALQALLVRIWRKETALAGHLAERAHAVRFAPDRARLEGMAARESQNAHTLAGEIVDRVTLVAAAHAPRPGTLTATKLSLDLDEIDELDKLYWRACAVGSNAILREKLEALADGEAIASMTTRGILSRMDSYVTDRQ